MRKIPDTISEEEFKKIIKATKKLKLKTAFVFGYYQCLRISEVLNLTKSNIDMEEGFVHVKEGKGNNDRDIPLMDEVKHYKRYLPIKMTRQGLHKAIKTKAKKVLKKDIYFHTLRHSGASMYLNDREIDIKFIQKFLGHKKLSTTEIYLHVNPKQLQNAFKKNSKPPQM